MSTKEQETSLNSNSNDAHQISANQIQRYPSPLEYLTLEENTDRFSPIDYRDEEEKISGDKISQMSPPHLNSSGSFTKI